jgi:hypothetical protein
MAAKKAPAKKTASAADFRKADQKSIKQYRRTFGGEPPKVPIEKLSKRANSGKPMVTDAEATKILKRRFMDQAALLTVKEKTSIGLPKRGGSPAKWAEVTEGYMQKNSKNMSVKDLDNPYFQISAQQKRKILDANSEKWITPLYKAAMGKTRTKVETNYSKSMNKNKKKK